jgi:LPXTG-site transpeptidase (sortase) family protein
MKTTLKWIERGLLAVGTALAIWCAIVLVEARHTNAIPIPPPRTPAVVTPPRGETPEKAARSRPIVEAGAWVARLEAPTVHLSATVLEGTADATLDRGAGHIEDTPFPGEPGNVGIAGHRDTIFRPVRSLRIGDPLVLTDTDHVYRFRITKTSIVNPEDVYVLDPAGHPTLTLVTCYPFEFIGHAPRRFIVHADLVATEARAEPAGTAGGAGR